MIPSLLQSDDDEQDLGQNVHGGAPADSMWNGETNAMRQRSFEVRYAWTCEVVVLYRALAMVSIPSEARRVNFQHQTRSLRYDSER